jgi:HSP20 family protein
MSLHAATKDSFEKLAQNMGEMIDSMFQSSYVGFRPSKTWEPAVNVYEDAGSLMVCVELAGMRREEIDVQVLPGTLTIRGTRADPDPPEEEGPCRLHLLEIHHGQFSRTISLPENLDVDGARAQYRNGYLWVRLPKQST